MYRCTIALAFLAGMGALSGCGITEIKLADNSKTQTISISAVQPSHSVSSSSIPEVRAGNSLQFSLSGKENTNQQFVWSINGVAGGNAIFGSINSTGLYTAPVTVPSDNMVKVTASSIADVKVSATAAAAILNPIPSIASITANVVGGTMVLSVAGENFVTGSQVQVGGAPVTTSFVSTKQLTASFAAPVINSIAVVVSNPAPGLINSAAYSLSFTRLVRESRGSSSIPAARLLDQATFGPTASDIALVQTLGMAGYIDQQMDPAATPISTWLPDSFAVPFTNSGTNRTLCNTQMTCVQIQWFQNALQGPDQLRQRTAFALSQIWVISASTIPQADSYLPFIRIMSNDAFSTYDKLMNDVTLSSAMGFYLDMGNSAKAVPGQIPNENYARELMQLFTVGLYLLNDDGTYQLDGNNNPIPTYTEFDVQELARVFTGWAYKSAGNTTQNFPQTFTSGNTDRTQPMVVYNNGSQHDTGAKSLLCGSPNCGNIPAGQLTNKDLTSALQIVSNHSNVPPFVSKQLIEHLVTSNPSPAYVNRISQVFKDDGTGSHLRGNLAAVVKAILLDPEARQGDAYLLQNGDGHLREPVLYATSVVRGLDPTYSYPLASCQYNLQNPSLTPNCFANATGQTLSNVGVILPSTASNVGQNVLFAPSVFNYFPPDYAVPGTNIVGPEFQLLTSATAPLRANFIDDAARNNFSQFSGIDFTKTMNTYTTMAANPDALVDALGQTFLHGQMTAGLKNSIVNSISSLPANNPTDRARTALYLVLSSSEYQVIR